MRGGRGREEGWLFYILSYPLLGNGGITEGSFVSVCSLSWTHVAEFVQIQRSPRGRVTDVGVGSKWETKCRFLTRSCYGRN